MTLIGANGAGKSSTLRALSGSSAGRQQGHPTGPGHHGHPVARAGRSRHRIYYSGRSLAYSLLTVGARKPADGGPTPATTRRRFCSEVDGFTMIPRLKERGASSLARFLRQ